MTDTFRVVSWNVQGEIGIDDARMQAQLEFIETHCEHVDLFLFQAVNYEARRGGGWSGQLGSYVEFFRDLGIHVIHTGDWANELATTAVQPHHDIEGAHNRCNLVASRWPIERRALTLRNRGDGKPRNLNYYYSHFPEKLLVGAVDLEDEPAIPVDGLTVWDVGIVNGAGWGEEKIKMLETVYARIALQSDTSDVPIFLGGDFNAPKNESATGAITPHGANKGQYTRHPLYGDPYYLRDGDDRMEEYRFDRRWQLAEARIFDTDVGEWGMRDAYWAAEQCLHRSSTDDYTHVVHAASPSEKRLDHLFVSEQFEVEVCEIWNGIGSSPSGLEASDHAPVVATVTLD